MGLMNYEKVKRKFHDSDFVLEIVRRLEAFDTFHCLRDSTLLLASKGTELFSGMAKAYVRWLTVCNGGLLFDTTLLSVTAFDEALGFEFSTLREYNTPETYRDYGLPEGYFIVALRSYGDPICLSQADSRVYLWDSEEGMFSTIWETFFDFLADEVDTALELIAHEDLEPIPFKVAGED